MEPNPLVHAKKVWSFMRLIFGVLKKGISKTRFFTDLNLMMRSRKIAGKALHNLLFHHHNNWASATFRRRPHHLPVPTPLSSDDEFSCTTTPQHPFSLSPIHKKHYTHAPPHTPPFSDDIDGIIIDPGVIKAVGMLSSFAGSPGFWKSPMVKQLRITDSPFPLSNGDEVHQVDEDAEKFITRFYNGLKRNN